MDVQHLNHCVRDNTQILVLIDYHYGREEPLLEDPNVATLLKEDTCEGLSEEVAPQGTFLVEERLHVADQGLSLGRRCLADMLEDELIEEVEGSDSICLHFKLLVTHGVQEHSNHLFNEISLKLGEEELEVVREELEDHEVGPFVNLGVGP